MTAQSEKKARRRIKKQIVIILYAMMILAVSLGCGNPEIDVATYGSETLTLIGIIDDDTSQPVTLTITELQSLNCVTIKTNSTSDKIGNVKATGPLLETVLDKYGVSMTEIKEIIITATDGYEIVLNQPFISENQLILAFGINGEPLGEDEAPLRLIVPESDSAYWIRMIESIEIVR